MTHTDVSFRRAVREDVASLLRLLPQITSRPGSLTATTLGIEESTSIFDRLSSHGNVQIAVGEVSGQLVAALTLVIVPNLTYGGRPWSVIENVVVDRGYRGQGVGKELMRFAFEVAEKAGCYKVQLSSGPKQDQVGFYRSVGMENEGPGFKKRLVDR